MDIFLGVVVGLIVLMILVVAHEFGHFIAARRNGVKVLEFGIGFPPRAIAWIKDPKTKKWRRFKKSEWKDEHEGLIFSLNYIPIGGFCQMDGESAEDSRKGTFGYANFWQKTKILFAGVGMNWLVAWLILTVLAWTGMPTFLEEQFTVENDTRVERAPVRVASVHEDSPASRAGFEAGDYILKVNEEEVWYGSEIIAINSEHAGEEVEYTVRRTKTDNCECIKAPCNCPPTEVEIDLTAKLNSVNDDYLLGVSMESSQSLSYSTWSAPIVGAGATLQITGETFKGLGELVWNLITGVGRQFSFDGTVRESGREAISAVGDSVTGPVGILGILFPSFVSGGPADIGFIAALISISLACMNVLPIPALDGGRWALIGIYKLRKRKLTKETEEKIVARAFMVLIALIVIVTILDITRFFR